MQVNGEGILGANLMRLCKDVDQFQGVCGTNYVSRVWLDSKIACQLFSL
jgi:hypothetical protein